MQSKIKVILDFSLAGQLKHVREEHRSMLHKAHSHSFNFKSNKATTQFIRHNSKMEKKYSEYRDDKSQLSDYMGTSRFQSHGHHHSGAANLNCAGKERWHAVRGEEAGDSSHRRKEHNIAQHRKALRLSSWSAPKFVI